MIKVNLSSIKSKRTISMSALREVCIANNYYTRGNNEEYNHLLNMVASRYDMDKPGSHVPELTDELLMKLSEDIFNHSDVEGMMADYGCCEDEILCDILSKIVDASHTGFVVSADYE